MQALVRYAARKAGCTDEVAEAVILACMNVCLADYVLHPCTVTAPSGLNARKETFASLNPAIAEILEAASL